ncbi:unnamed protein product, partial [Rotaria sordida]
MGHQQPDLLLANQQWNEDYLNAGEPPPPYSNRQITHPSPTNVRKSVSMLAVSNLNEVDQDTMHMARRTRQRPESRTVVSELLNNGGKTHQHNNIVPMKQTTSND